MLRIIWGWKLVVLRGLEAGLTSDSYKNTSLAALGALKSFSVRKLYFCQTSVLGLVLGVDFTFAWDNKNNDNPHLNFMKGTVQGDKEQGVGIRDKG